MEFYKVVHIKFYGHARDRLTRLIDNGLAPPTYLPFCRTEIFSQSGRRLVFRADPLRAARSDECACICGSLINIKRARDCREFRGPNENALISTGRPRFLPGSRAFSPSLGREITYDHRTRSSSKRRRYEFSQHDNEKPNPGQRGNCR